MTQLCVCVSLLCCAQGGGRDAATVPFIGGRCHLTLDDFTSNASYRRSSSLIVAVVVHSGAASECGRVALGVDGEAVGVRVGAWPSSLLARDATTGAGAISSGKGPDCPHHAVVPVQQDVAVEDPL